MPKGMRAGVCVCTADGAYIHDVFMYSPRSPHCRQTLYHLSHQGSPIHDGRHSVSAYGIFVRIQSVYGVLIGLCEKRAGSGRAAQPSLDGASQHDHGNHLNPNLC